MKYQLGLFKPYRSRSPPFEKGARRPLPMFPNVMLRIESPLSLSSFVESGEL